MAYKISIITVVFNAAGTLEDTIQSVLDQKCPELEYIIIDGGSTDGSADIIQKYADRLGYWVSEKDNGIYDAMNKGVRHAQGDFIYFLGADDLLCKNIIPQLLQILTNENTIYYGDVLFVNSKRVYDGKFNNFKFALRNISHQAIFYPSAIFNEFEFELAYKYLADYVLNLKAYASRKYAWKYMPLIIAHYNDTGSSAVNADPAFLRDRLKLLRAAFPAYVYYYAAFRSYLKKVISNG